MRGTNRGLCESLICHQRPIEKFILNLEILSRGSSSGSMRVPRHMLQQVKPQRGPSRAGEISGGKQNAKQDDDLCSLSWSCQHGFCAGLSGLRCDLVSFRLTTAIVTFLFRVRPFSPLSTNESECKPQCRRCHMVSPRL